MSADEVVTLIVGLAWPAIVLVTVLVFRDPLKTFIADLGQRASKIDMKFVAIDLRTESGTNWRVNVAGTEVDVRALTSERPFDSFVLDLLSQLEKLDPTDVLVMDLGDGHEWLSSRMYLFTSLLASARGVRCIAFTHTQGGVEGSVLGCATPEEVRDAIAEGDPWVEAADLSAVAEVLGVRTIGGGPLFSADRSSVTVPARQPPFDDMQVARLFVRLVQRRTPPMPADGWLSFMPTDAPDVAGAPAIWERARWLDPTRLPGALRAVIDTTSIVTIDDNEDSSDFKRRILLQPGRFVMLRLSDGRLKGVVERPPMLDQAVRATLYSK